MASVRFLMDAGLFSDDIIARTAHRYTSHFFVDIGCSGDGHTITLTPRREDVETANLEGRFRNDALDERLRERIRDETAELHLSLVQAALRRVSPGDVSQ